MDGGLTDIDRMSADARAEHYRHCAQRQLRLAASAETPELRATCLELAAMWTRLAEAVAHAPEAVSAGAGVDLGRPDANA